MFQQQLVYMIGNALVVWVPRVNTSVWYQVGRSFNLGLDVSFFRLKSIGRG
jgi:hypothetical protein